jgi:hypothetical protein
LFGANSLSLVIKSGKANSIVSKRIKSAAGMYIFASQQYFLMLAIAEKARCRGIFACGTWYSLLF